MTHTLKAHRVETKWLLRSRKFVLQRTRETTDTEIISDSPFAWASHGHIEGLQQPLVNFRYHRMKIHCMWYTEPAHPQNFMCDLCIDMKDSHSHACAKNSWNFPLLPTNHFQAPSPLTAYFHYKYRPQKSWEDRSEHCLLSSCLANLE